MNTIKEAIEALKQGEIIIVADDENRENEGDFLVLGEFASAKNINFMARNGCGLICTPISSEIANRFHFEPMVSQNTDAHQTAFTISIDFYTTTTGISALERSETIMALLRKDTSAKHFNRPGHVFPLIAKDEGILARRGHTEAAVTLATLCETEKVAVICEIMNEDGTMARMPELEKIANKFQLKFITIENLVQYIRENKIIA